MKPSRLCFGSLTLSPLQKNLSVEDGVRLLLHAYNQGVNFYDTAELYDNYPVFKAFLKKVPREQVIISTKCYAYSRETAEESLTKALVEMDTSYVDYFLLHEQESVHTLRGHAEAIDYFLEQREKGLIKKFGISTHHISGVKAAARDQRIEVLHPIINKAGIGIVDGTRDEMIEAIREAKKTGKFIYAMKALGGGHLLKDYREALSFVLDLDFLDSIAIGMQSIEEIDQNIESFKGAISDVAIHATRRLHIAEWCIGCGNCVERCQQNAMTLKDNKAVVDHHRCVLCSYCVSTCPDFCIKVI